MPRFSVIIPIYGVEKYIKQCVNSLLKQNYNDVEIILVDDGSRDNSPKICDDFAKQDNRIRVIHKANGGLVSARKAGALVSTGDYILNVDGDDWVDVDYFTKINDAIEHGNAPDVVCFGAIWSWKESQKRSPLEWEPGLYSKERIKKVIFPFLIESSNGKYFSPAVWSKAIRRELYVKHQMLVNEGISIGEDAACTKPIIYEANSLYIMDDCIYFYRQNEQSMTKNKKAFSLNAPILIAERFDEVMSNDVDMKRQIDRNLVHNLFNAIVSQFNRKEEECLILEDVENCLNNTYVKNALKNCYYDLTYIKGRMAKLCLDKKLYWLMKWFCDRKG